MECRTRATPLHLKFAEWHDYLKRADDKLRFELADLKTVLMPRQPLLKKLDPSGTRNLPVREMRAKLDPYVRDYLRLIIQNRVAADMDIKGALQIYKSFHKLARQPTWGDVPPGCTCKVCFPDCVCKCTLLFASLFNLALRVPADYIAATVSGSKKCKSIKGTAGRKTYVYHRRAQVQSEEDRFQGRVLDWNQAIQVSCERGRTSDSLTVGFTFST
jgi:hypothetical protein